MNEANTKALLEAGPRIYKNYQAEGDHSTFAHFGFECGDGWFELLKSLTTILEALQEDRILDDGGAYLRVAQVKEKFGGLRFYVHDATEAEKEAIDATERLSLYTCEDCGKPGTQGSMKYSNWLRTQCSECWNRG